MSSHVPSTGTDFLHPQHCSRTRWTSSRRQHRRHSTLVSRAGAGPNSSAGSGRRAVAQRADCASSWKARPRISSVPHRGPSIRRDPFGCGGPRAPHAGIQSRSAAGRPPALPHGPSSSSAHGTGRQPAMAQRIHPATLFSRSGHQRGGQSKANGVGDFAVAGTFAVRAADVVPGLRGRPWPAPVRPPAPHAGPDSARQKPPGVKRHLLAPQVIHGAAQLRRQDAQGPRLAPLLLLARQPLLGRFVAAQHQAGRLAQRPP